MLGALQVLGKNLLLSGGDRNYNQLLGGRTVFLDWYLESGRHLAWLVSGFT